MRLSRANVSLTARNGGENRNLTTDAKGACRFQGLVDGEYLVQGEAPGFEASTPQAVEVKGDTLSEVTVSLGIAQVRTSVIVTAAGTPQSTDEVSKALTVVDGDTIDLRADSRWARH